MPLAVAYLLPCAIWLLLARLRPGWWPAPPAPATDRPRLDLALGCLGIAGVLGIGEFYRRGWLFPATPLGWVADNLIIYSPIFVVLLARRQRTDAIYLSLRGAHKKLLLGAACALASTAVFLALRGELDRFAGLFTSWSRQRTAAFVPVFLEGVALAFLVVRLRWVSGTAVAASIPALLFALAHVPSQLAEGRSAAAIVAFFAVNTGLVAIVLLVLQRSQDVIWLGLVHYLMDVAIGAV